MRRSLSNYGQHPSSWVSMPPNGLCKPCKSNVVPSGSRGSGVSGIPEPKTVPGSERAEPGSVRFWVGSGSGSEKKPQPPRVPVLPPLSRRGEGQTEPGAVVGQNYSPEPDGCSCWGWLTWALEFGRLLNMANRTADSRPHRYPPTATLALYIGPAVQVVQNEPALSWPVPAYHFPTGTGTPSCLTPVRWPG